MKRSNVYELQNLQGVRDQMTAIGCWRVMGVEVEQEEARRLFDRFTMSSEVRETVDEFCRVVVGEWTDEVTRKVDELINRVLAFIILIRSHALADFDTTLRDIYGGKASGDVNALF